MALSPSLLVAATPSATSLFVTRCEHPGKGVLQNVHLTITVLAFLAIHTDILQWLFQDGKWYIGPPPSAENSNLGFGSVQVGEITMLVP